MTMSLGPCVTPVSVFLLWTDMKIGLAYPPPPLGFVSLCTKLIFSECVTVVSPSLQPKFVYWVQVKSVKPGQREVVKPVSVGADYEWNSPLSTLSHDGEFLHLKNTSLTSVNTRQHSHMMARSSSTSKTRLSPLSTLVNTGQVRQVKAGFSFL